MHLPERFFAAATPAALSTHILFHAGAIAAFAAVSFSKLFLPRAISYMHYISFLFICRRLASRCFLSPQLFLDFRIL